jgi:hypothetical protein
MILLKNGNTLQSWDENAETFIADQSQKNHTDTHD